MTKRVDIATCADVPDLDDDARLFADVLRERGVRTRPLVWDRAEDPLSRSADAVVIRSTWDYQYKTADFLRWTRTMGSRLFNPSNIVRWNVDKRYLVELQQAGLEVVPSAIVTPEQAVPFLPESMFVIKPTVSAGSKDTAVYDGGRIPAARDHIRRLQAEGRGVMVQPYLDRVETDAETAIIFVDGVPFHAMRKGPLLRLDEPFEAALFRQEEMSRRTADPDVLDLAVRACRWVSQNFGVPLYARVDIVRDAGGRPVILELELIEPSLFLDHSPETAEALADALLTRLSA